MTITSVIDHEAAMDGHPTRGNTSPSSRRPPRGTYLSYAYTSCGSPARLKAPEKPGAHEVCYIMGASEAVLARSALLVK